MGYTAPAKHTVHFVASSGGGAYGGGATKAAWDAGTYTDFMGADGETITADTGCALVGATGVITKVGIGTGVTVGTLAYVIKTAGAGTITTGIYEVTAQSDDTITIGGSDVSGDSTVTVNVGGAYDSLINAFDDDSTNAAAYNRTILTNLNQSGRIGDLDTGGGDRSINTWKRIIGCDSNMAKLARGSYVTIDNSAGSGDCVEYGQKNIYTYGMYYKAKSDQVAIGFGGTISAEIARNSVFENCKADNGTFGLQGGDKGRQGLTLIDSIFEGSTDGIDTTYDVHALRSQFRGGTQCVDIGATGVSSSFDMCLFDGGATGILFDGDGVLTTTNCTFYNQSTQCYDISDTNALLIECNNILIVTNTTMSDIGITMTSGSFGYSDYCCGYDAVPNAALKNDIWPIGGNTVEYSATRGGGDNSFIGDPLMVDPVNDDFRLKATSPCLHTGIPTIGSGKTSIGAWLRKQHPAKIKLDGT